ncbi:ABC-type transport system, permease and ATPase components [Alteracholeplasma palmae J233]|uniref:ABC-type transport system, permease and ATPase components n=1 Tax=Alteracholeplasma palmae (strain ATCC 49389 / J233) TaxID=1318466 RepID=U4KRG0_ALTPJ|nr:ABC transporter ATP-binding protein [Alteracholeplasma palmae]CCV64131.1 ABC-type transport system, permease and ATPase components [Alteracholeplasma palmae J233]
MIFGKHFGKYYIKFGIYFLLGIGVLITLDWLQLEIPLKLSSIIDNFDGQIDKAFIYQTAAEIMILVSIIAVGRFLWRYLLFGTSRKIEFDLREKMFNHATKLSQDYYSQEKIGGLMTYFTNDLEAVRQVYGMGLLSLVDGLCLTSFVIYRMAVMNLVMTLLSAIPLLLVSVYMILVRKRIELKFKIRQEAFEKLSDVTQESFTGISVIKAYVKETKEALLFKNLSNDLKNKNLSYIKLMTKINVAISFTLSLVIITILTIGSFLLIQSKMTPGELTAYTTFFFTLMWPIMALSQFMSINSQGQASAKRVKAFLNKEITVCDADDIFNEELDLTGEITVKNLTFTYPDGDSPVLKNVSFKIHKGQMVGVLGRTGSGKSSLVDLFLRVHNAPKESIYFDQYDMMNLPIKGVRNLVGYVPQDNFLFSDTILNNIEFSSSNPSIDNAVKAAKLSDVYDNIMEFSEQFETVLGERGVTVSGGQKQRISIARAIAKDPQILILDDSVSAVDTKTEEAIISNLHQIRKNKTTIFIAHRISTVKNMDQIIVLDKGEISAIGTHKELLKTSALYQDMVHRQELEQMVQEGMDNEK